MSEKAEWRDRDFYKHPHPPREPYEMFKELAKPSGDVIARIEVFKLYDSCFYATTPIERSGPLQSYEAARAWCEARSGNKAN